MYMRHFICFALIVNMACSAHSQNQWVPDTISVHLPMLVRNTECYNCSYHGDLQTFLLNWVRPSIGTYWKSGDSVRIDYDSNEFEAYSKATLSFKLDTIRRILDHVRFELFYSYYHRTDSIYEDGYYRAFSFGIEVDSLGYWFAGNKLVVRDTATQWIQTIDTAYYSYNESFQAKGSSVTFDEEKMDSIRNDQTSFVFELSFQQMTIPDRVALTNVRQSSALTVRIGSDRSIRFSCPPILQAETFIVYDICGRYVLQHNLEMGESTYMIPSNRLPPGTYFARLGNLTTSFIVP